MGQHVLQLLGHERRCRHLDLGDHIILIEEELREQIVPVEVGQDFRGTSSVGDALDQRGEDLDNRARMDKLTVK